MNKIIEEDAGAMVPILQSNPDAAATVYLNFYGARVNNPNWFKGILTTEHSRLTYLQITDVYSRVAEKFRPFTINITTDSIIYNAAPPQQRVMVAITPSWQWYGVAAGGVAFVGSFGYGVYDPAWIFETNLSNNTEFIADAIAHEAGHTLGLQHHGQYNSSCQKISNYHNGKGNWGPIMGSPYGKQVVIWAKGSTTSTICNDSAQDGLKIITANKGVTYKADDITTPKTLTITNNSFADSGIIEKNTDTDIFKLIVTSSAKLNIITKSYATVANLNGACVSVEMRLLNSGGIPLYIDTANSLSQTCSTEILPAGTYYIEINNRGMAAFTDYGYTKQVNYGSLGKYYITGNITVINNTPCPVAPPLKLKSSTNSVALTWALNGVNAFNLQLLDKTGKNILSRYNNITTSSYIITGLLRKTIYQVQIQPVCGGIAGGWGVKYSFLTF